MKTLALIPARSGSKGVPGKNVRLFAGKPLLTWAVEVGRATCNRTYVTTDDKGYGIIAAQAGAGIILRPPELAQDDTPMLSVVQHALRSLEWKPDVVVLLQPTSPLRHAGDVRDALATLVMNQADSVVSVVKIPPHYSPDYAMSIEDGCLYPYVLKGVAPVRRQDAREAYSRDGTVYATLREIIDMGSLYGWKCLPMLMPTDRSVNIDTEDDWREAERLMMQRWEVSA